MVKSFILSLADNVDGEAFCCLKEDDFNDLFPLLGQIFRFKQWYGKQSLPQVSLWPEVRVIHYSSPCSHEISFHAVKGWKEILLTIGPKWINRNDGSRRICQLRKTDLPHTGRYTGRFVKCLENTTKSACIQFNYTLHNIFYKYRGGVTSPNTLNFVFIDFHLVYFWFNNLLHYFINISANRWFHFYG